MNEEIKYKKDFRPLHYEDFLDALRRVDNMTHGEVQKLKQSLQNKPAPTDRKADSAFHRLLDKHDLCSSPRGVSLANKRDDYMREYHLKERVQTREQKIAALQQTIKELEEEIAKLKLSQANHIARNLR